MLLCVHLPSNKKVKEHDKEKPRQVICCCTEQNNVWWEQAVKACKTNDEE